METPSYRRQGGKPPPAARSGPGENISHGTLATATGRDTSGTGQGVSLIKLLPNAARLLPSGGMYYMYIVCMCVFFFLLSTLLFACGPVFVSLEFLSTEHTQHHMVGSGWPQGCIAGPAPVCYPRGTHLASAKKALSPTARCTQNGVLWFFWGFLHSAGAEIRGRRWCWCRWTLFPSLRFREQHLVRQHEPFATTAPA